MNLFGTTGQERRAWLDQTGQDAINALQYYAGPYVPVANWFRIADAFNPVSDIERAGTAARGATMPGLTGAERLGYVGSAATDMASVLAPVAGAAYADDAARGLTEGLANLTMPADDAASRFLGDESGAFAGIRAKTADLGALDRAKAMTEAGASRDDVWSETGWFRGVDGQWRFEIDDRGAAFRGEGTPSDIAAARGGTVGDAFYHWDAFKAYPHLRDVSFKGGLDEPNSGTFMASGDYMVPDAIALADDATDPQRLMLHELQHAIQSKENFARGGNPSQFYPEELINQANDLDHLEDSLLGQSWRAKDPAEKAELLRRSREAGEQKRALRQQAAEWRFNQYQSLGGEVEARNVETRRNMTPDQRRATPPWLTQDVPDEQQIIRGILQKYGVE